MLAGLRRRPVAAPSAANAASCSVSRVVMTVIIQLLRQAERKGEGQGELSSEWGIRERTHPLTPCKSGDRRGNCVTPNSDRLDDIDVDPAARGHIGHEPTGEGKE